MMDAFVLLCKHETLPMKQTPYLHDSSSITSNRGDWCYSSVSTLAPCLDSSKFGGCVCACNYEPLVSSCTIFGAVESSRRLS
jgi:hypothetical protein